MENHHHVYKTPVDYKVYLTLQYSSSRSKRVLIYSMNFSFQDIKQTISILKQDTSIRIN